MFPLDYFVKRLGRNKVNVLLFHKVPRDIDSAAPDEPNLEAFEALLDYVMTLFPVISLQDAINGLARGSVSSGAVCITFDDGYDEWENGVVPILKARDAHATFFITTGQFEGVPLWHERIRHIARSGSGSASLHGFLGRGRKADAQTIERQLKYLDLAERERLLSQIESELQCSSDSIPRMTKEQLRSIHNAGFGIGAHTVNHPILTHCDEATARYELGASKETLEEIVGGRVDYLAYPNGRSGDFSDSHVEYAKQLGYTCALTTQGGTMNRATPLFHIPRFTPWGPDPIRMSLQLMRNLAAPL